MSYSAEVLTDSPKRYFRLGESSGVSMTDSAGIGDGTYFNSPTLGATGLISTDPTNTSASFSGSSNYCDTGFQPATLNAVTLEAWVKATTGGWVVTAWGGSGQRHSVLLYNSDGSVTFACKIAGTEQWLGSGAGAAPTGTAHHIVGTFDGTTQRIYVDGVQVASAAHAGTLGATSGVTFKIALIDSDTSTRFVGTIDEVAIYESALSAARIASHFAAGSTITASLSLTSPKMTTAISAEFTTTASLGLTSPKVSTAISASYLAPVEADLGLTGPLLTGNISATYDPAPIECTLAGTLPLPSLELSASRRVFVPPTSTESSDDSLFGRYGIPVGQSVVKTNGHYVTTPYPWLGELTGLTEGRDWFQGGRSYDIDPPTATALQADGYTLTEV